jgi:nicotinamidase-related amidase
MQPGCAEQRRLVGRHLQPLPPLVALLPPPPPLSSPAPSALQVLLLTSIAVLQLLTHSALSPAVQMPGAIGLSPASARAGAMRPALLLIDMQEHFREGMAERLVRRLNPLAAACRAVGAPVIFTQHGHPDSDLHDPSPSVLVNWWSAEGSIRHGSPAWQLLPELHREPGDHVITSKRTYDAFQGTELQERLQRHGCDTVIIGGVMTNLCCETTARSAFTKNYQVLFLSDGTATASKAMHDASLLNLGYGFARIHTCAEAAQLVKAAAAAATGEEAPPRRKAR